LEIDLETVNAREGRLRRLLELRAPTHIIDVDCLLVLGAHHGGPWRGLWWHLKTLVREKAWWLYGDLRAWLHLRFGLHWRDEYGCICCAAEKMGEDDGLPFEDCCLFEEDL